MTTIVTSVTQNAFFFLCFSTLVVLSVPGLPDSPPPSKATVFLVLLFNSDSDNVNADQSTDDINTDEVDFDQNNDDVIADLSIDDPKSVREDEETEKNFSYSTDQFSCDGNSNDFDVDLNSDNEEGRLFHVNDGGNPVI